MSSLNEVSLPLSGLLNIQKNYLNDLGRISQDNKNVAGDLADIQEKLERINTSFNTANTSADQTLTHQITMEDILAKEHDRLLSKKDEIDNIHYGKMRAVKLNDSYRKRHAEYIRIIVAIIIAILIYLGLSFVLPEVALTLAGIVIFSILLIYSLNVVIEIYKRDNMNHDSLYLAPPSEVNDITRASGGVASGAAGAGSATPENQCSGEACCDVNSRWDSIMNKCIISCPDPNKPISQGNECIARDACAAPNMKLCGNACIPETATCGATTVNTFSTLGEERIKMRESSIKPFTPYEYCEYSPIL